MIYFVILAILFLFALNYDFLDHKIAKNKSYILLCLLLIIFSAIRFRVGGDTLNYMIAHPLIPELINFNLFEEIPGVRAEKGWQFLTGIAKLFGPEFYWVQLLQSLFVNISIFYFIKKNLKYKFLGILIYYIVFYLYLNFEILRESIAICIFLIFGYPYLNNKKYFKYYISVGIAFFFHSSAICLIILPVLINKITYKINNHFLIFTIIFLIGNIFNSYFYKFLSTASIYGFLSSKFESYLDYQFTINGIIMSYISYVLIPLILANYLKDKNEILRKYLLVYALFGSLIGFFTIFFRFINYFTLFLILAYSVMIINILKNKKDSTRLEHSLIVLMIIFCFYNFKVFSIVDSSRNIRWYNWWYPYETIFDEKIDADREYMWEKQFNK